MKQLWLLIVGCSPTLLTAVDCMFSRFYIIQLSDTVILIVWTICYSSAEPTCVFVYSHSYGVLHEGPHEGKARLLFFVTCVSQTFTIQSVCHIL